jgi:molybdenum transport protein
MSIFIPDSQLETFLLEDAPYGDLTCQMLGLEHQPGLLSFHVRHAATVCGSEEAARLAEMGGARLEHFIPSGEQVEAGTCLLEVRGEASALHQVWRMAGNILEYLSGIATRTANMRKVAQTQNPHVTIAATRKIFPGTKRLVTKAVMAGGGQLHRLGLSETVLVFKNHLNFLPCPRDFASPDFVSLVTQWRAHAKEKKITIEVENIEQALALAHVGIDGLQLDKMPVDQLRELVVSVREINPEVKLIAAGGLNQNNIGAYAATGVDILVLSSVYFGPPADIGARMEPLESAGSRT